MRILALDVGNTNIVVGTICDGKIEKFLRMRTDRNSTWEEYAFKLSDLINFIKLDVDGIDGTIIGSVVPSITDMLTMALFEVTGKHPKIVGPGMKTGMNVRIDDPGTLAADLVLGGVAAIAYYGAPALVIDVGTATTITAIDKDKCFLGGAIIPGIKLGIRALAEGTSLLPDISITPPKKSIAANTVDCMRSGAVFGTAAMLDGMIDRMQEELGYECKLIATGGMASLIEPYCKHDIICDDDLLLKGMWQLYTKNI